MDSLGALHVTMFNNCSITRRCGEEERQISDQDNASKKMWLLLEFLLWNHGKPVPRDALLDLLWGDETAADPSNSLKGLLFRVRNMLGADGLGFQNPKQIILYQNGNYFWNEDLQITLDTELFEQCYHAGEAAGDDAEAALPHLLRAVELYKGDFLPQMSGDRWVMPLNVYYHSRFLSLCAMTIEALHKTAQHEEIIRLCRHAISIEPYDEPLHRALIRALAESGSTHSALQHYKYTVELFMNQFGVTPSQEMNALYRELSSNVRLPEQNLQLVRESLQEDDFSRKPYFCGFAAFKEIYQLSARSAARTGEIVQLAMLTVLSLTGHPLPQQQAQSAMKRVHSILSSTLRLGDVITQYSPSQYLIMLPSASYENARRAMGRVMSGFQQQSAKVNFSLQYSLIPLLPVMP